MLLLAIVILICVSIVVSNIAKDKGWETVGEAAALVAIGTFFVTLGLVWHSLYVISL